MKAAYVISILFDITASNSAISFVGNGKKLFVNYSLHTIKSIFDRKILKEAKKRSHLSSYLEKSDNMSNKSLRTLNQ